MMPLAKTMALKLKKNYLLLALSVIAGAVMANSYVPPSPGPLFLASAMNVSVGLLMVCGILLGLCTISVGFAIAVFLNKKFDIPLRDAPDAKHQRHHRFIQQGRQGPSTPDCGQFSLPCFRWS